MDQITDHNVSLMQFPHDFTIKIMGVNSEVFATEITAILRKHYPDILDTSIRSQPSKQGHYLGISATVHALDQKSLDALYMELTKHPDIKMVL